MAKPSTTRKVSGAADRNTPRVAPVIAAITAAVPMPERNPVNRGSKTAYPFEKLEVGQSFGVTNKTAANLASIVSNQNRKPGPQKRNPDGSLMFKMNDMKDANGNVIGQTATTEGIFEDGKKYFAVDTDPKTDPDKATVRVFRQS